MISAYTTILQVLALMLISLVAGAMFGIWRGYDPSTWSTATFLEVHQGAVGGLNTLLPVMGLVAILSVATLAFLVRSTPQSLWLYAGACILMILAGAITRFGNQPINGQVMNWTVNDLPDNWELLRDTWWRWHHARLAAGFLAELLLISAIFVDRNA